MLDPAALLEAQSAATRQLVQSLADADMAKDTPGCPGWTIKEVVAHLTTGAEMFAAIANGTLDGANWMPERERRLAENAALPSAELRLRYAQADQQLLDTFKGLSPEQRQATRRHPALGEVPVERFLFMRLSETTVHNWDIRAGSDPAARLEAPATQGVLQAILAIFPEWFLADQIAGVKRTYRFVTGGQQYTLALDGGKAAWAESATPDTTISLEPSDFLLLMTGRLSAGQLLDSGRAQASGDVQAARELSGLFKAYGGR